MAEGRLGHALLYPGTQQLFFVVVVCFVWDGRIK